MAEPETKREELRWPDGKHRCRWANPKNPLYVRYHDEEWGVPLHDDQKLFELLILENFQAGLSWEMRAQQAGSVSPCVRGL